MPKDGGLFYEETLRHGGEGMLRRRRSPARFVGRGYRPAFPGATKTFRDVKSGALDASVRGAYRDLWNRAQEGIV